MTAVYHGYSSTAEKLIKYDTSDDLLMSFICKMIESKFPMNIAVLSAPWCLPDRKTGYKDMMWKNI